MVFRLEGYCGGVMNALDLRINRVITAVPDTPTFQWEVFQAT